MLEIGRVYLKSNGNYNRRYLHSAPNGEDGYGVPESIYYKGKRIATIPKNITTYCCGFTFWVAMRVLQSNKVIEKMEKDIRDKLIDALEKGTADAEHINAVKRKVEKLEEKTNGKVEKSKVIRDYATKKTFKDIKKRIKKDFMIIFTILI